MVDCEEAIRAMAHYHPIWASTPSSGPTREPYGRLGRDCMFFTAFTITVSVAGVVCSKYGTNHSCVNPS